MASIQAQDALRFPYEPLLGNEIRLLRIHPILPSGDSRIHCDLHHFPLVEPASSGELSARLAKSKSSWHVSNQDLGFRVVGHTVQKKALSSKLKQLSLIRKAPRPNVQGRFAWGDFVALSYTWGYGEETSEIVINGKSVKVRLNLESALEHLRCKGPIRAGMMIWIDALCLDQMNTDEKNAQVPG